MNNQIPKSACCGLKGKIKRTFSILKRPRFLRPFQTCQHGQNHRSGNYFLILATLPSLDQFSMRGSLYRRFHLTMAAFVYRSPWDWWWRKSSPALFACILVLCLWEFLKFAYWGSPCSFKRTLVPFFLRITGQESPICSFSGTHKPNAYLDLTMISPLTDWFSKIHLKTTFIMCQWIPGTASFLIFAFQWVKQFYCLATLKCLALKVYEHGA